MGAQVVATSHPTFAEISWRTCRHEALPSDTESFRTTCREASFTTNGYVGYGRAPLVSNRSELESINPCCAMARPEGVLRNAINIAISNTGGPDARMHQYMMHICTCTARRGHCAAGGHLLAPAGPGLRIFGAPSAPKGLPTTSGARTS